MISALNTAYDIAGQPRRGGRSACSPSRLTVALAIFLLISSTLVIAGPEIAGKIADAFGLGATFTCDVEHPAVAVRADAGHHRAGAGLLQGPDVRREWVWFSPGAALATLLWLGISLGFRAYLQYAADYNATYGTIGGVIILLLWLYLSGFAILVGAEMNAEITRVARPRPTRPGARRRRRRRAGLELEPSFVTGAAWK